MNRIMAKRQLTERIAWFEVVAPRVAKRWKPGQFVMIRPAFDSERIPLTIVDGDAERGVIVLVVQAVGKTTAVAASLQPGQALADLVGPLGEPASTAPVGRVLMVGGGVGVAELLPVARAFHAAPNHVTALCGARSAHLRILNSELCAAVDQLIWATDDGSTGFHGNVVELMRRWITTQPAPPDLVHVIGPIAMMQAASQLTSEWGVRTYASLNPVMVDGTGMCGGCRVTVGGKVRFACLEGPEFNAHEVDFDELARRNQAYRQHECAAMAAYLHGRP